MWIIISTEYCENEITTNFVGAVETKEDAIKEVARCKKSLAELFPNPDYADEGDLGYYYIADDGYINNVEAFEVDGFISTDLF